MTSALEVKYDVAYQSPVGWLGLREENGKLVELAFSEDRPKVGARESAVLDFTQSALDDYFSGKRAFYLPEMQAAGTPFQKRVWQQLLAIPYGQTMTYGEVAKRLQTHPRAVGGACRANPLVVLVPCHRVVSASGLGGFSGQAEGHWPRVKDWLLRHEVAD